MYRYITMCPAPPPQPLRNIECGARERHYGYGHNASMGGGRHPHQPHHGHEHNTTERHHGHSRDETLGGGRPPPQPHPHHGLNASIGGDRARSGADRARFGGVRARLGGAGGLGRGEVLDELDAMRNESLITDDEHAVLVRRTGRGVASE